MLQQQHDQTEEKVLDRTLAADPVLMDSLRREQRQRTRKSWIVSSLMICTIAGIYAALFFAQSGQAGAGENLTAEGWKLWTARHFTEAEEKFQQAVVASPKSVSAWNGLGWSRLNQAKLALSQEAFQQCLELEPKMPAALNGMGQSLLGQREYKKAKEFLTQAAPQAPAAWYGLARVTLLTGEYDEAATWCQKVVNSQPNDEISQKMLAAANAKSLPEDLKQLIEPPGQSEVNISKGWQSLNMGQPREAIALFNDVLKKNPKHLAALNGLGFCLLSVGDAAAAKEQFQKCLELSPPGESAGPKNGLARCLKIEGKTDEAIKLWKEVDEATDGVDAGTVGLAETYLELGNHKTAHEYFLILTKAHPDNQFFQRGLTASEAGLKDTEN